jgi:hypothetical protein
MGPRCGFCGGHGWSGCGAGAGGAGESSCWHEAGGERERGRRRERETETDGHGAEAASALVSGSGACRVGGGSVCGKRVKWGKRGRGQWQCSRVGPRSQVPASRVQAATAAGPFPFLSRSLSLSLGLWGATHSPTPLAVGRPSLYVIHTIHAIPPSAIRHPPSSTYSSSSLHCACATSRNDLRSPAACAS